MLTLWTNHGFRDCAKGTGYITRHYMEKLGIAPTSRNGLRALIKLYWILINIRTSITAMTNWKSFIAAHEIGVAGRQKNKSRLTIFVACSMTREELPLLCIGTVSNPRWSVVLGGKADPPVDYRSSAKGWMTTKLFTDWLDAQEKKFKRQGRRCLLLVDNCPCHVGLTEKFDGTKTNLRLVMLPKNTTSCLQPCDQGVIKSLKSHYRSKLARLVLNKETNFVSLHEGLCMVRAAWAQVSINVIINCWRKSRLLSEEVELENVDASDEDMNQIAAIEDEEDVAASLTACIDSFVALLTPQNEN